MHKAQTKWSNNRNEWTLQDYCKTWCTDKDEWKSLSLNTTDVKSDAPPMSRMRFDNHSGQRILVCLSYKAIVWLQKRWNPSKVLYNAFCQWVWQAHLTCIYVEWKRATWTFCWMACVDYNIMFIFTLFPTVYYLVVYETCNQCFCK